VNVAVTIGGFMYVGGLGAFAGLLLTSANGVGLVLDQPAFLNACIRIATQLEPEALLDACKAVERDLGRDLEGGVRHGPRPIDVDLLLLGDTAYRSERLSLPHEQVTARRFVLIPLLELDLESEAAARSLGARETRVFRSIILPNILPGILSGVALAFARAVGEIGAIVLISGNLPFKTEVASVYIFGRIESDSVTSAAAVSVVLLVLSLIVLLAIRGLGRLGHDKEAADGR